MALRRSIGDVFIIVKGFVGWTDERISFTVKHLCKFRNDSLEQGSAKLFSESSKPTVHRQNRSQYLQTDAMIRAGERSIENTLFSSTKGLRTGFAKDVLTKKETVFRLSLWWARRDLNLRHPA